jgi:oligopeptidase B
MWRGGGDHTPEWEDAGRLGGREEVLKDAEEVVRSAAASLGLGAAATWLYGRSAGGLWVGGLIARYPEGELARGAYMEVPYLDVLRTTTNRTLPLTEIETDEFGLPDQRISDFAGMLRWSPMERLTPEGTPGVAQIVRTGLNDNQVLAYESAKWVVRSRAQSRKRPIFLAIQSDQGHFVHGDLGASQEAEDLAVILKISSDGIR